MEKVVVSKLKNEDVIEAAKLIQTLHNTMLQQRRDIFIQKEENWEAYLEEKLDDSNYILLVARIENNVVGVCTAEIKRLGDDESTRVRDVLFIDYIAVRDEYRRNKIGTNLLNEIKDFAKENNISSVELNVWGFNASAIEFYEKNNMKQKRIVYEFFIDKEK